MRSMAARFALPAAVVLVVLLAMVAAAPAQEVENETTTIAIDLQADGDARFTVTLRLGLEDETSRDAFDDLAERHASGGESPLVVDPFERAATLASEETGREMEIQDEARTADRTDGTGRLVLAFTWTNFTRASDGQLLLGDAFQRPGGTWLPGLEPGQELRISFPEGYSPLDISMPGTRFQVVDGTIRVEGPASFEPGTPSVVLDRPGQTTPPPREGISATTALGIVVLAVLLTVAVLAYLFRDRLPDVPRGTDGEGGATEGVAEETEPVDPMSEPLLSDEERVLKLLEARDGRMKQVEIVEATDWSNAKVSQLLSEMEEEGQIDKLRIGRENLISLPGRGPGGE